MVCFFIVKKDINKRNADNDAKTRLKNYLIINFPELTKQEKEKLEDGLENLKNSQWLYGDEKNRS